MGYYVGNSAADAPAHRGWIVGTFIEDGPRKTEAVEIKYGTYGVGFAAHPPKVSATYECNLILSGRTEAVVDGQRITLSSGEYISIEPGTPNNLLDTILEDVTIVTIKAPSDPSAKKVVEAS